MAERVHVDGELEPKQRRFTLIRQRLVVPAPLLILARSSDSGTDRGSAVGRTETEVRGMTELSGRPLMSGETAIAASGQKIVRRW